MRGFPWPTPPPLYHDLGSASRVSVTSHTGRKVCGGISLWRLRPLWMQSRAWCLCWKLWINTPHDTCKCCGLHLHAQLVCWSSSTPQIGSVEKGGASRSCHLHSQWGLYSVHTEDPAKSKTSFRLRRDHLSEGALSSFLCRPSFSGET